MLMVAYIFLFFCVPSKVPFLTINGDVISPKYYTVTYDQSFKAGERTAKIVANTANYTTAYTREESILRSNCPFPRREALPIRVLSLPAIQSDLW